MSLPLSADLHRLLVRPKNTSLLLGLAHHAIYRPAKGLADLVGKELPKAADPAHWGAMASGLVEKADFHLSPGFHRTEAITLDAEHLKHMGRHLADLHAGNSAHATKLEGEIDALLPTSYNTNIRKLIAQAHTDPAFKVTLHGVKIPSLTGEVGKTVRSIGSDVAALYGAGELADKATRLPHAPTNEKKGSKTMPLYQEVIDALEKAADILDRIPAKQASFDRAEKLYAEGIIAESDIEKHAAVFENNPGDAELIYDGLMRGGAATKTAGYGEPFEEPAASKASTGSRRNAFDALCLENSP
jgi:hypothetical protein